MNPHELAKLRATQLIRELGYNAMAEEIAAGKYTVSETLKCIRTWPLDEKRKQIVNAAYEVALKEKL